ncbi:hypothetical protein QBC40DRAFT_331593 [Triangularia verruculosa]|uniref:GPI inositol-deacylase n=1 Tax=Triangularia verruculosa TaxID=2587418 RepID=A0AAN6XD13_9PEZI|nr:hypothetical protein QBC40DRAFT_331593 [Triangularia verruculosa]
MSTGPVPRIRDGNGTFDIRFPLRRLATHSLDGSEPIRALTAVGDGVDDAKGPLGLNILHVPSNPTFDFIFVHGLGGGSRKTWSKTGSVKDHWPAEWLPKDPAFQNVRVHSYGYNSDWTKGNSTCLNIHHIAKSFLAELAISPHLEGSQTNLVLIGHSMGGLVIKKAYMLARQDPLYQSLAARIRVFFFLGTPHRGSDSAKLLKNILQIAASAPDYVTDLVRGSEAIRTINDEFRHYSDGVELWSLYETQKLSVKGFSAMIVDPDSATLGYRGERQIPVNADHRSICKFNTPHDANYLTIRNSLACAIRGITDPRTLDPRVVAADERSLHESELTIKHTSQQMIRRDLATFLAITDDVDDDLFAVQDARADGTCRWLLDKAWYQTWKTAVFNRQCLLWMHGKPATGKTVLSGFAIDDIRQSGSSCSYHFFRHSHNSKSKLSSCLRSLAFQMAMQDQVIFATLSKLQKANPNLDVENERSLWRTLFMSGILPALPRPQFWILDGLDECSNATLLFDSVLRNLGGCAQPVRILITSRETLELHRSFTSLGSERLVQEQISTEETLPDIERLVRSRAEAFVVVDDERRNELIQEVICKSRGLFLWTQLVLDELSNAFSEEAMKQVLEEVPRGMEPLYHRALQMMTRATRAKPIIKRILEWTVCALRPLTVLELNACLEIQLKDKFPRLQDTIATLCGQLVTVDKHQRVQVIHETAREFLLDGNLNSELAINRLQAHTDIARVCLTFLTGSELRPERVGRRLNSTSQASLKKRSPIYAYACSAFSYHLARADPCNNDLLSLLSIFLKANILTWIKENAEAKSLVPMVQCAKELKTYTDQCMAERSPLYRELQLLKGWATDLQRIVGKFSGALLTSPSAIYSLIPPLCPEQSAIHGTTISGKRISILGLANLQWDDRLSCIDLRQEKASAICYGIEFLAVGVTGGRVRLYHARSCQEYRSLNHGEIVRHICFRPNSDLVASCGLESIVIWNIRSGDQLHVLTSPKKCVALWFEEDCLFALSSRNEICSWDCGTEGVARQKSTITLSDSPHEDSGIIRQVPCAVSIGITHKMMAIAYSGKPIILWDLQGDQFYGDCGKRLEGGETSTHPIQALQINPNSDIELLAASYLDGDLVILDPFSNREMERKRACCHTLGASADGRLLAGGSGAGVIQIFLFDTLKLLYKVRTSDLWIKHLAFSPDGMNLADLRDSQCNIWVPPVLLAGSMDDDVSEETPITNNHASHQQTEPRVECIAVMADGVLCGKEDGSVNLCDLRGNHLAHPLYSHRAAVYILLWVPSGRLVVSVCISNRLFVWSLSDLKPTLRQNSQNKHECLLDTRVNCNGNTVRYVVAGHAPTKLILSTRTTDHLWDLATAAEESSKTWGSGSETRIWVQHPTSPDHVVCIRPTAADVYAWHTWSSSAVVSIDLGFSLLGLQLKSQPLLYGDGESRIVLELEELDGSSDTKHIIALCLSQRTFPTSETDGTSTQSHSCPIKPALGLHARSTVLQPQYQPEVSRHIANTAPLHDNPEQGHTAISFYYPEHILRRLAHVIGIRRDGHRTRLVFLDISSWVCSTILPAGDARQRGRPTKDINSNSYSYTRHFFIPYEWLSGVRHLIGGIARGQDVVLAKKGDVAIVKGGFDFEERVDVSPSSANARSDHAGSDKEGPAS